MHNVSPPSVRIPSGAPLSATSHSSSSADPSMKGTHSARPAVPTPQPSPASVAVGSTADSHANSSNVSISLSNSGGNAAATGEVVPRVRSSPGTVIRQPSSTATASVVVTGKALPTVGSSVVVRASAAPSASPPGPTAAQTTPTASSASASSPASEVVMLPHPLVMQATVLRNPDWFEQRTTPELAEPGDILYDVLRAPQLAFDGEDSLPAATVTKRRERGEKPMTPAPEGGEDVHKRERRTDLATASLAAPAVTMPMFGIQPLLSLPDKVGAYVTREHFKALLCFQNSATYPLSTLRFRVDVVAPCTPQQQQQQQQQQQHLSLLKTDLATLAAKANFTFPIDVPLAAVGTYTLSVHVTYTDPTLAERKLSWASSFPVEQAVTEVAQRVLQRVPLPLQRDTPVDAVTAAAEDAPSRDLYRRIFRPPQPLRAESAAAAAAAAGRLTLADAVHDLRLPRCAYALTVGLRNACGMPLVLSDVKLKVPERGPFALIASDHVGPPSASPRQLRSEGHVMQPGELRQFTFRFLIDPAALSSAPMPSPRTHGRTMSKASTGVLGPAVAAGVGCVEWTWRRANGDGGTERSSIVKIGRIRASPELELRVLRVRPSTAFSSSSSPSSAPPPAAAGPESTTTTATAMSTQPLRAGCPLNLDLCLIYSPSAAPQPSTPLRTPSPDWEQSSSSHLFHSGHSGSDASPLPLPLLPARLDVALKVRAEKLAPSFLYSGPALRPLGHVEPDTPLLFSLTLLPWESGLLPLLRAAVEVVDARAPEIILWPPAAAGAAAGAAVGIPNMSLTSSVASAGQPPSGHAVPGGWADVTLARSGSSLFTDRFLVPPATGTVLTGGGAISPSAAPPIATAAAAAAGGSMLPNSLTGGDGTAPAVACVPLQVLEDTEQAEVSAVLCEVMVQ